MPFSLPPNVVTTTTDQDQAAAASTPSPGHKSRPSVISTTSESSSSSSFSEIEKTKYFATSNTATDLEAQTHHHHHHHDEITQKHLGFLRYTALNVYRRLFSLAFVGNALALILVFLQGPATPLDLVNASAVNLAVCGLCRQPVVVNTLFLAFGAVPRCAPMRVRRWACKVFHVGGLHSGAGVAALFWYLGFAGVWTYRYRASPVNTAVLVLVWVVLALLVAIIVVAYPLFRSKRHDYFELTHRFANWLILVLFWVLVFLLGSQEPSLSQFLIHLPAFWILLLLTLATIHPWLLLRRVPVVPESLSPHAVRLHFNHTTVKFGQGISVAKHPLSDWHSFASFTDRFDTPSTKFSCLVSKAGDWTRSAIRDQPTYLWTRGIPTYGFGYVFRMFPRIIVVTTGSGIGPCLSFIDDENRPDMRVVWQTRSPLATYGERTMALVRRMDADPVILDTTTTGRVDMLPMVLGLYKEFGAEAVCVISNAKMTKSLVYSLEMRGIPAYGPIFDS